MSLIFNLFTIQLELKIKLSNQPTKVAVDVSEDKKAYSFSREWPEGSKTRCQNEFAQITGFSSWVDMAHLFTVLCVIVCCLVLELNAGKFCKHLQGSANFHCKGSYYFCVAAFKLRNIQPHAEPISWTLGQPCTYDILPYYYRVCPILSPIKDHETMKAQNLTRMLMPRRPHSTPSIP